MRLTAIVSDPRLMWRLVSNPALLSPEGFIVLREESDPGVLIWPIVPLRARSIEADAWDRRPPRRRYQKDIL
jgi:hypothetical protein